MEIATYALVVMCCGLSVHLPGKGTEGEIKACLQIPKLSEMQHRCSCQSCLCTCLICAVPSGPQGICKCFWGTNEPLDVI